MSIGLLIITHNNIGQELLETVKGILQKEPIKAKAISIQPNSMVEKACQLATEYVNKLDTGDGVLILTDIYGATPCNITNCFSNNNNIRIVAGVNLAMLIRIMNYPDLPLEKIIAKTIDAGHDSIFECTHKNKN